MRRRNEICADDFRRSPINLKQQMRSATLDEMVLLSTTAAHRHEPLGEIENGAPPRWAGHGGLLLHSRLSRGINTAGSNVAKPIMPFALAPSHELFAIPTQSYAIRAVKPLSSLQRSPY